MWYRFLQWERNAFLDAACRAGSWADFSTGLSGFALGSIRLCTYGEAIAAFKEIAIAAFGEVGGRSIGIARVYALTGRQREARQMISGMKGPAISIAAVYAALGDKDGAFRILEKAIEERSSYLVYVKEDPPLETLHSDPRWQALLRRMNFPPE